MSQPVQILTPHLVVNNANAAIDFYKKAPSECRRRTASG